MFNKRDEFISSEEVLEGASRFLGTVRYAMLNVISHSRFGQSCKLNFGSCLVSTFCCFCAILLPIQQCQSSGGCLIIKALLIVTIMMDATFCYMHKSDNIVKNAIVYAELCKDM